MAFTENRISGNLYEGVKCEESEWQDGTMRTTNCQILIVDGELRMLNTDHSSFSTLGPVRRLSRAWRRLQQWAENIQSVLIALFCRAKRGHDNKQSFSPFPLVPSHHLNTLTSPTSFSSRPNNRRHKHTIHHRHGGSPTGSPSHC